MQRLLFFKLLVMFVHYLVHMRNISGFIVLCLICACVNSGNKKNMTASKNRNCDTSVLFGDVNICIPNVKGYKDAHSFPDMAKQSRMIEANGNAVLGFYISDTANLGRTTDVDLYYEDYYTIFSPQQLKDVRSDESDLKETMRAALQNFSVQDWDSTKNRIKQMTSGQLEVNKPVLIRTYSLNDNISSAIVLMKVGHEGRMNSIVFCMNMLLIKDRIVSMAYYLNYTGVESIIKLKKNSDRIALELLNANS